MRSNYSEEFKKEIFRRSNRLTLDEILELANTKYSCNTTKKKMYSFLKVRNLKWKDYDFKKVKKTSSLIGTEKRLKSGWIIVKVAPSKWQYKQRYLYEKYHNVTLTRNDCIIFLDNDKNNFDINNLKKVTRKEMLVLIGRDLKINNKQIANVGIDIAKLVVKTKEKEEGITTSEKRLEYRKRYSEEHREEIKARAKKYYYEHREEMIEKHRKWVKDNKEKTLEYRKEYYKNNKEKEIKYAAKQNNFKYHTNDKFHNRILELSANYRNNHKEHYREYAKEYRLKQKTNTGTKLKWYEIN